MLKKSTLYSIPLIIFILITTAFISYANEASAKGSHDQIEDSVPKEESTVDKSIEVGGYAAPYNSAENVDPTVGLYIFIGFLLFVLYVIFRVWIGLKKDEKAEGRRKWRK